MLRRGNVLVSLVLAVLAAAPLQAGSDRVHISHLGSCTDGRPWDVYVLGANDGTDCDPAVPNGTAEAHCRCLNGVIAAVTSGTAPAATSSTLDRKTSATTVTNSVTETTIYSYTIPAGTVDANGELRLTLENEYLNNSGANRSLTFKVKLGGSTIIEGTTGALGPSALNRVFSLTVHLTALGATNSQKVLLEGIIPAASGSAGTVTTGTGMVTTVISSIHLSSGLTALTQDMTASKVLEVSVTHPTSTATQTWTTYSAVLELLNP